MLGDSIFKQCNAFCIYNNIELLEPRVTGVAYLQGIQNIHDYFCFYLSFH